MNSKPIFQNMLSRYSMLTKEERSNATHYIMQQITLAEQWCQVLSLRDFTERRLSYRTLKNTVNKVSCLRHYLLFENILNYILPVLQGEYFIHSRFQSAVKMAIISRIVPQGQYSINRWIYPTDKTQYYHKSPVGTTLKTISL